uniref:Centrosomal protein of 44 kDa n=1 Tax=Nothobranchius furzeri TaxID=105023 RepID=A0A8C6PXV4_NOTFU
MNHFWCFYLQAVPEHLVPSRQEQRKACLNKKEVVAYPIAFLPILSFSLTSSSPPFAESLVAVGLELAGKTDLRFTDTLYKVLRDVFHYKPMLSKQQFLQSGFSQRKISFTCDIINLVLQRHCQLKKNEIADISVRNEFPQGGWTFP